MDKVHATLLQQIQALTGLSIGKPVYLILSTEGKPYRIAQDTVSRIVISKTNLFVEIKSYKNYNKHFRLGTSAFLTEEACQNAYKQQGGN